jgi:hypothetical protein
MLKPGYCIFNYGLYCFSPHLLIQFSACYAQLALVVVKLTPSFHENMHRDFTTIIKD